MPLLQEPDAVYHARTEISNSMMSKLDPPYRFYSHFEAEKKIETETTEAMIVGRAMHMMLLQPDEFKKHFAVWTGGARQSKKAKEAYADLVLENPNKEIITQAQFDKCEAMANALFSQPTAAEMLRRPGLHETTILWTNGEGDNALACRGRADKIIVDSEPQTLLDPKTTEDASPWAFQKSIVKYGYHKQAMYYLDGLAASGDPRFAGAADWPFVWPVVEKKPPHCVALYTMDDEQRERGRILYNADLNMIRHCRKTGVWPHYTKNTEILKLPDWAYIDYDPTEVIT